MHMIFFKYNEAQERYDPSQAGTGLVPNGEFDKVLPVKEHVAYQMDKVFYKDGKLHVHDVFKDKFMNESEYQAYISGQNTENFGGTGVIDNPEPEVVYDVEPE